MNLEDNEMSYTIYFIQVSSVFSSEALIGDTYCTESTWFLWRGENRSTQKKSREA